MSAADDAAGPAPAGPSGSARGGHAPSSAAGVAAEGTSDSAAPEVLPTADRTIRDRAVDPASDATFTAAETAGMRAALAAAARGVRGANPVVGAALLGPTGQLLHVGHHRGAGTPHAEVDVLQQARAAGTPLEGSTLVVTLEPCHHTGRTGPCTAAVEAAGVPRVVYALADPTAEARGGGAALRSHGVHVRAGLLADEARELNERWLRAREQARPFVSLKIAQSLDGRVAAADGTSQWITGLPARAEGHALRTRVDAILVGGGTLRGDDPALTARDAEGAPCARQPLRAVMSTRPVPPEARIRVGTAHDPTAADTASRGPVPGTDAGSAAPTWGAATETSAQAPDAETSMPGPGAGSPSLAPTPAPPPATPAAPAPAPPGPAGGPGGGFVHLSTHGPREALPRLRDLGAAHVLVEGGPTVAAAFLAADLVDELWLHQAPLLLGDGAASVGALGIGTLAAASSWRGDPVGVQDGPVAAVGEDLRWHLRPAPR
ncbi:bifunctional diaminohydroxyphosphoribosylaminopyrimidine deaminase/5-amino-6-(5-phosphoribosylamino)uracil reductase RibD [Kocuria rhizophila]|uniref:bifunctional diaminohydroxyphosphoribosylaminopyrimidine deaminase/5-amino-6-(5-phosphoribosylamino)uracil reductase RibD n=1 Tax=Kocuria rhizophila TaxID=72000 RepID=UPI002D7F07D8|nr:bifunctional diaminohydroxyphosphoribosylaminopyrimidine deaminase/5-amino-6-(5-phosphoribosylamino)uracil reductase RibD [Kocuria rhizophila]